MAGTKKRILLTEDEKILSDVLQLKLTSSGFEVKQAFDGVEALEILKTDPGFDLILLDLIMPNLNGFSVLEKIREQKLNLPVFVLSNLGQTEDIKKAQKFKIEGYIIKSDTDLSEIVDTVKAFFV